jgi:S-adenosylmethionine decarboxylase
MSEKTSNNDENGMGERKMEYCGENGYMRYAGVHLIIDLRGPHHLTNIEVIGDIMREAAQACGAHLLEQNYHQFSLNGGVSGVALLQESHISIHTWPEYEYAAVDIFVCGSIDPYKAIPVLRERFLPESIQVVEVKRGIL